MIELPDHPWFLGCQFHPEFKSKPYAPHPIFRSFIAAAKEHRERRLAGPEVEAAKEAVEAAEDAAEVEEQVKETAELSG